MTTKTYTPEIALQVTKQVYSDLYKAKPRNVEGINESIVAGGAIRDIIFNKPIKDIDIFIPTHCVMHKWKAQNPLHTLYKMGFRRKGGDEYDDEDFETYESLSYDMPVQLIKSKFSTPKQILLDFPVSISRVYWSPADNKIHKSEGFKKSQRTKEIFINHNGPDTRAYKYGIRLTEKYNGKDGWVWRKI